jgi:hypothetical protein
MQQSATNRKVPANRLHQGAAIGMKKASVSGAL